MYQDTKQAGPNVFRQTEKSFRKPGPVKGRNRRKQPPVEDFSSVIDFTNLENNSPENLDLIKQVPSTSFQSQYFGTFDTVYTIDLPHLQGLYFVPNPFSEDEQKYWVKRCLLDFPVGNHNNITNLEGNKELWDDIDEEKIYKLRWASLGYHFQWTPRIYTEEFRGETPKDLQEIIQDMAKTVGYDMVSEATIINYYTGVKCRMGAHVDSSEEDLTKPIVSFSFGNTVVFLIGDRTLQTEPTALYIRSGDVVIMSDESRYSYHAIPRMIEGTCPSFLYDGETFWEQYMETSRINMNCRQVKVSPS
eukprot:TRINITY_DN5012_c0_g1_i2.p1 TRINITY_DN5012_c0_g1~~TRINITY_DN5012_c0_g1_i2.p1  ORF type:complete len:304 (-),score=59.96 TRINITY_DN5012_c0_g1_i2:94-1005(-)